MSTQQAATFQETLEIVESLPEDQQEELIHIIRRRRVERRREMIAGSIKKARAEHARGEVIRGAVDDLFYFVKDTNRQEDAILLLESGMHDEVY
ncbi:MAG TPA: hypothetical protein VNN62_23835 [Methylomirabilota bacterium]|jgi:hypothetical protein|nr:hypothetical protein [Methylomirabilota bacterium]